MLASLKRLDAQCTSIVRIENYKNLFALKFSFDYFMSKCDISLNYGLFGFTTLFGGFL